MISSCATHFSTVALCLAAFICFWYWEHVRACPAWSLRICLTSRELSAKDGEGGPLGTLADIASSVHGVLARLGDGWVLGALSDSVEPSLLEELPLVLLEAVSVVSSVPVVDEEPGLLSDVPTGVGRTAIGRRSSIRHIVMILFSLLCCLRPWNGIGGWSHRVEGKLCGKWSWFLWCVS